jgi:hypothetical protein
MLHPSKTDRRQELLTHSIINILTGEIRIDLGGRYHSSSADDRLLR